MKNKKLFALLPALLISTVLLAQSSKLAKDYLNVPGPIAFENNSYNLTWSAHPSVDFYKQEYMVKGELESKYKTMILMDVVTSEANIKNVLAAKVNELKKIKDSNPVVNYEVIENAKTGEYLIDFLLTASSPDGTISIVERNVYRYKVFTDKSGQKGILLFGISTRAYGQEVDKFFVALKANRKDLITRVSQFNMPEIAFRN